MPFGANLPLHSWKSDWRIFATGRKGVQPGEACRNLLST
jgi:hypothetical protein